MYFRSGPFKSSAYEVLQNSYEFAGSENPITISRVYSSEFICEYNMAIYPFDTQVLKNCTSFQTPSFKIPCSKTCVVQFVMKGNSGSFVRLVAGVHEYLGPIDLTQYFIKSTSIGQTFMESEGIPGVEVC